MSDGPPIDRLTGLLTRDALDALDETFRVRPAGVSWSIIMADVDDFKMINDVHGHLAGDRVLQQVSFLLLRTVRETDQVVRFGGDEFLAILPHTTATQAANVCQRFLEDVSHEIFQHGQRVGVSMGLAESADSDREISQVVSRADSALYEAKALGKNRFSFYREKSRRTGRLSFDHFIDRQDQLRKLRGVLDEVLEGGSRAVLLTGEPGVGKSRLAAELRHYCSYRECSFVTAKYDEIGGPGPFATLSAPLDGLVGGMDPSRGDALRKFVGEVLPETAALFPAASLAVSKEAPPPEWARARIFYEQMSRMVSGIISARPLVFFIDDLQWAYPQDLDLIGFLARTAGCGRIMFLFGMRSPVENEKAAWEWMKGLMRLIAVERIDLHPLEREHAANLVLLALKDPRVPQELLDRITSASGGNPFYLRELLRSLTDSGAIRQDSGRWSCRLDDSFEPPEDVTLVVKSRLDRLERVSREALRMGALIPGGFLAQDIAFMMETDQVEAERALEDPSRAELIFTGSEPGEAPEYRFVHDCVRSVLVSEISPGLRKQLYSRLAARLEEILESGHPELLRKVAYCYGEGVPTGKAARYASRVAAEAADRQATFEQAFWLERFLGQAEAWGGAEEAEVFRALMDLANLHIMHAKYAEASRVLETAAGQASDPRRLGEVLAAKGYLLADSGDLLRAAEAFEKAVESPLEPEKLARALLRFAYVRYLAGEIDSAKNLVRRVRDTAPGVADRNVAKRLEASCLNLSGIIEHFATGSQESLDSIRKAAAIYEETRDALSRARVHLNLAAMLGDSGMWDEQIRLLRGCLRVFTEVGDAQSLMITCMNLSAVHRSLNQLEIAEDLANRALELAEAAGSMPRQAGAMSAVAAIERRRGNHGRAAELAARAVEMAAATGQAPLAVGCMLESALALSAAGEPLRADGILGEAESLLEKAEFRPQFMPALLFARGVVLYSNATVVDEEQNEQALALFREFRLSSPAAGDPLDLLEAMYYEAECLQRLERDDELHGILASSAALAGRLADGIENRASRADFLSTPFIVRLIEMCSREGIEAPSSDLLPASSEPEDF
ncbi:diguanylate cyclase [Candidatus Fermentibacteria bacterium]|nr:diguanylate cyclase [Candidatus Fermentibacteria bacterium]